MDLSCDLLESQYKNRISITGYGIQVDNDKMAKLVIYSDDLEKCKRIGPTEWYTLPVEYRASVMCYEQ
jgi:hypothetical protein